MMAMVRKQEPSYVPLAVETLSGGVEVIERLTAEWQVLCAEGRSAQPFFQPEWIAAHVRAFVPDKQLTILTARRQGQLRAVLPLVRERTSLHGVPVRKLRSLSNPHSCRFDVVAGRGDEKEAVCALWQALQQRDDWDVIELSDVPEEGLGEQLLIEAANEGFPAGQWPMPAAPYLPFDLSAATTEERLDATFKQTSNKRRNDVRRLRRKLEEQAAVSVFCDEAATPTELAQFYALESAGWKGQQGTAIACDERLQQFYNELAQAKAARGRFLLYRMQAGEQTIAMQFCVTNEQTCYLLKPAYDESLRKYSPGHLLVAEVLPDLIERGLTQYDLLSPVSEWKNYWTKMACNQAHCYIFRRGTIGQALHAWKFQVALRARQMKQKYQAESAKREGAGSTVLQR
jgi:CelD/BcsL family acetyltransferase involved in cellulose biosynthesis